MGSVSACVLRVQLVPAATCTMHSHRVQNQAPKAGKKTSSTVEKTRTGPVNGREFGMFEKKRMRAAKELSEEGTAKKKNKAQPRRRVRLSPEKGVGTARGPASEHAEKERMKKNCTDA